MSLGLSIMESNNKLESGCLDSTLLCFEKFDDGFGFIISLKLQKK